MSGSSMESFKTAVSKPDSNIELISEVQDIIHAFRSALEILRKVIRKRILDREDELHRQAQLLRRSLDEGETTVDNVYRYVLKYSSLENRFIDSISSSHCKAQGEQYVKILRDSGESAYLEIPAHTHLTNLCRRATDCDVQAHGRSRHCSAHVQRRTQFSDSNFVWKTTVMVEKVSNQNFIRAGSRYPPSVASTTKSFVIRE